MSTSLQIWLIRLLVLIGVTYVSTNCGGSSTGLTSNQREALIKSFTGIESLTKQEDLSWVIRWVPIDDDGVGYAIYKAADGEVFNFNSPLILTALNIHTYEPENVYTEGNQCFIVRVSTGSFDENEKKLCTENPVLKFDGLKDMERVADGSYILKWDAVPLKEIVYSIYQRDENGDYDFGIPTWDFITEDFQPTSVYERGRKVCFVARYVHKDLPTDTNVQEKCTVVEAPITFNGVNKVTALNGTTVKIEWENPDNADIDGFVIYNGSSFKELFATAESDATEVEITGLVPGRQYSFGVRAVDVYDREDKNIVIRSVVTPAE